MNGDEGDILSKAVKRFFGLDYLFPYQRLVISNILEAAQSATRIAANSSGGETGDDRTAGSRQIVILPTGAGKSLCFQLPAFFLKGATLVLYPLLALMADQARRMTERGFTPALLRGGQSAEERLELLRRVKNGKSRFIITNPETLLTPGMMNILPSLNIVHVVIDEAHCVSEWGESFRPSYLRIAEIVDAIRGRGTGAGLPLVTAFTATASAPVLEKIERYVFGGGHSGVRRVVGNPDRSNIEYSAQGALVKNLAVRDLLFKNKRPAIIFCSSREGVELLARYLAFWFGKAVKFYHAGLEREEKTACEDWFFTSGEGILTATCAYGMGVDKPDIRTVIHRDCPPSVEAYLQESGRAGRDGLASKAVFLWGPEDEAVLQRAGTAENRRRAQRLLDYARDVSRCRRRALLDLLDYRSSDPAPESPGESCCDVCAGTARADYREERSLADFFRRNRRRYTVIEAAQVLAGADSAIWEEKEARIALESLSALGKLKIKRRFPRRGKISALV